MVKVLLYWKSLICTTRQETEYKKHYPCCNLNKQAFKNVYRSKKNILKLYICSYSINIPMYWWLKLFFISAIIIIINSSNIISVACKTILKKSKK